MNIKQDPGCAPGFERPVNAEPGPMGAGAGAAAAIDNNEPSPRGAAIEKAQAELRRDLAVREERRRELEFLEKGGEPLDFKFGEAPLVSFSPLSPKEALVDRLLASKSEEEAVGVADVVINGDLSSGSKGCVGAVEGIDDMSIALVPANEQSRSRLSPLDVSVGDPTWTLNESASKADIDSRQGVVHGGPKGAGHVNRNRVRSQRLGNGHALPKELESVVGGDGQVAEPESAVTSANVENEDMVDMSYQVLPHQGQHGLPSKWNGLTTSQEYEPVNEIMARCGPVLEQHPSEHSSRDRASLPSLKSLQTPDVRVGSRVGVGGRDSDRSSLAGECSPCQPADRPDTDEQAPAVGERRDGRAGARQADGISSKGVVDANSTRVCEGAVGTADQGTEGRDGVSRAVCSTGAGGERSADSAAGSRAPSDSVQETHGTEAWAGHGIPESRTQTLADGSRGAPTHRDPRVVKRGGASSRGGGHLRVARAGADERKVNVHHVRVKAEDGVAEDRAKHLATQAEPGGHETNGAHSQELRTGAQAGATVGGAPRSIGRPPSNSGTPNCKYPGVVLPWEKGQDSAVQAEAERHNAELREKLANKARDDFILEEAEHLKVKRKLLEERKTMKACPEPRGRNSHWDYVLEEMKWMANDFWQERMWKRYQAAHVCLEIAMKKGEAEFLAADLTREQLRVSRILAGAVKDFWHTAEVAVTKEKSDTRGSVQEQIVRRRGESEVVPMDVDFPVTKEGSEKSVRVEKAGKDQMIGVQKYAIQLLKESGFQRIGQAEPPPTPERHRESNSILDQVHQVPLFYEVPMGSMEAYRAAVEAEHARSEEEYEKRRAAATAEAEALAAAEAAEDASAGADVSYADLSNDGGSQEDEPAIFTTEGSRISRKKRKKIFKTGSIGSRGEGSALQGLPYRASALLSSEPGIPSPLVTGKRSFTGGSGASTLPGSIPVKRARSSAANLRPRAAQLGASPGGYMSQRGGGSQFQQDDGLDVLDGSNQGDVHSDTPGSKGLKKKKKTRPYPGLSFSDGGTAADSPAKNSDGIAQELRHEQMKRKADTHWVSIGGSDAGLDTPGTPGSQGLSGQQNSKKQKSLRQAETNAEAVQAGQQAASALGANKLMRQNSIRDRNRRVRPNKVLPSTPTGVGIPWSAGEDQAILALVHDLGPNWELVSDVLSSNSQIKGICRKPLQCKERHKSLTERAGSEGLENTEDPSSSQPQASKQGSMRGPRGQSAAEEDTLKHFEQIIIIVQKYGARRISQSESEDQKVLQPSHPSHGIAISQFCTGSGGPSNPVDLADRVTGGDDSGGHAHPAAPPQGNVLGPPIVGPMPGLGMRPPAAGLPLVLPGTNGLQHLGQGSVSPAAMSAAAARDAQRFNMSFSSEEAARLQMATSKLTEFNARRAQQQAASGTSGVPVLGGLPNSNGLPMLSSSTSGGMLVGLNRGLSLPRAGLAGMGSPVVSSMGTAGLSGRLPPSGNLAASNVSRRIAGLVNMARNPGCTEEQRLQALQQLQSMAQQGDGQAGAALANVTGVGADMANSVDGLNQSFSLHHQHSIQQQQQQPQEQHQQLHQQQLHHMNNSSNKLQAQVQQHGHQMQLPGAPQAYIAVPTRMKEQQQQQQQHLQQRHQQQQQQQQKQRLLGNLAPNPQPQHMLVPPHQPAAPGLPAQHLKAQPHILPPQQHNSLQKQLMQQVGSPSQGAQLSAASSSLQSSPASPGKSGQQSTTGQQNERAGQMAQGSLSAKPPQPNQVQKQLEQTSQLLMQQQAARNAKGASSRGAMLMQGPPAQTGQASSLPGGASGQLQAEGPGQMQAGHRGVAQPQAQPGKVAAGSQAGNPGGSQSQGGQLHGPQSQTLSSVVGQQKGPQQQTAQGGTGKQQQGATSQASGQSAGQQAGPGPSPSQQAATAASSGAPSQQSQQLHRRQVAQPPPPRRLQTKQSGSSMGMPIPGQLAKTGAQPTGQGAPSQIPQAGQNPYQFGGTIPIGMSNPNLHGMPLSSALNSSAVEAQSAQWKPNQTLPPLVGGIYNLTRTSSPGPGQGPAMAGAGLHSNGSVGTSSLSSPGIQGVGLGSTPQGVGGVQGAPGLLGQKLGAGPGMSGRGLPGSQLGVVGGQRNQPASSAALPSGVGNMPTYQARPPAGSSATASPTSSAGVGVPQGGAPAGPYQGVAVPMSGATATAGQLRQPRGEHAPSTTSSLPSSQRAAVPAASGSTSADSAIPPSAPDLGPAQSAEATAASSS